MKKLLIIMLAITATTNAYATDMCDVEVCNKLKRFSLSPWSHIKDAIGESCYDIQLPKEKSVVGYKLDSSTRWYQGSFNPTKRTVTYIKKVYGCGGTQRGTNK